MWSWEEMHTLALEGRCEPVQGLLSRPRAGTLNHKPFLSLPGHLTFPTPVQNYRIFTYFIFGPPKGSNQAFLGSLLCLGLVTVQNWLNPYFGILVKSRQLWDDLIRIRGTKRSRRVQWLRIGFTIQAKRVQSQFYHEDKLGETTQSKNQQKI